MKRIGILILSTLLIIINLTSAVSAKTNGIKVSLDNIEDIMLEYSPDMKVADNNLELAEENYDDLVDKVEDLEDSVKNLNNEIDKAPVLPDGTPSDSSQLKKELMDLKSTLKTLKESKNKAKYSLKVARIQYDQNVKKAVFSAQQQYVAYLDTLAKKELKKNEVTSNKREIEANNMKYQKGFISKKVYESNLRDNTDIENSLEELVKTEETDLKNLYLLLGIPMKTQIIFNSDINIDLDKISRIKFQDDVDEMLDNNTAIKTRKLELDEAEDLDNSDYTIDNAEIYLKQEKNKSKLEFEKQYNTLISSYNVIKTINSKLNEKQNDFGLTQIKYNYGFVSKKQTTDFEMELDKERTEFISGKNNLYVNYLRYLQMKEGY